MLAVLYGAETINAMRAGQEQTDDALSLSLSLSLGGYGQVINRRLDLVFAPDGLIGRGLSLSLVSLLIQEEGEESNK